MKLWFFNQNEKNVKVLTIAKLYEFWFTGSIKLNIILFLLIRKKKKLCNVIFCHVQSDSAKKASRKWNNYHFFELPPFSPFLALFPKKAKLLCWLFYPYKKLKRKLVTNLECERLNQHRSYIESSLWRSDGNEFIHLITC